jgi:hypothetical protein
MKNRPALLNIILVLVFCTSFLASPTNSLASNSFQATTLPRNDPETITFELKPEESQSFDLTVSTGDRPINKGDVMFVFDRTSSMGWILDTAKSEAVTIMNGIRASLPDTWFGVASFMDYNGYYSYPSYATSYGSGVDMPWELNIDPTSDVTEVSNQINGLFLGNGDDDPESYTRALYELQFVKWRTNSKKIIVMFGDQAAHDLDFAGQDTGGDPGRDAIAQTSDDLDYQSVIQELANKKITVIAINGGGSYGEANFRGMSTGLFDAVGTNGQYYEIGSTAEIPAAVVNLISNETQNIDQLSINVQSAHNSWLSVTPGSISNVPANSSQKFTIDLNVPKGTQPGFYPFILQSIADNTILDITYLYVKVPTDTPKTELGFDPKVDGFQFGNESSTPSKKMFEQFFGQANVYYPNGNPIKAAWDYYDNYYYKAGDGGSCDGFSATSLMNYSNLAYLYPVSANTKIDKTDNLYSKQESDVRDAITYAQAIQTGVGVNQTGSLTCHTVTDKDIKAYFDMVRSNIEVGSPVTLSLRWDPITFLGGEIVKAGGHSLAPYKDEIKVVTG